MGNWEFEIEGKVGWVDVHLFARLGAIRRLRTRFGGSLAPPGED